MKMSLGMVASAQGIGTAKVVGILILPDERSVRNAESIGQTVAVVSRARAREVVFRESSCKETGSVTAVVIITLLDDFSVRIVGSTGQKVVAPKAKEREVVSRERSAKETGSAKAVVIITSPDECSVRIVG